MSLFPLRFIERREIARGVGHYVFQRDDGQALDFNPGQFVQIHFQYADGNAAKRSYSLATRHDHTMGPNDHIEIAVSHVPGGSGTALFEALQPEDRLHASGPHGQFCLKPGDSNRRYLLIATGTGIATYRAMMPLLERQMARRDLQVTLLFGARTHADLLYADEFRAWTDRSPAFRFIPCLSREPAGNLRPGERSGRVQRHLAELQPDPVHDIAYLCGNPAMVDACVEALKASGLRMAHIRREKYTSSQ